MTFQRSYWEEGDGQVSHVSNWRLVWGIAVLLSVACGEGQPRSPTQGTEVDADDSTVVIDETPDTASSPDDGSTDPVHQTSPSLVFQAKSGSDRHLFVVDISGNLQQLTSEPGRQMNPAVSPSGTEVAYESQASGSTNVDIHVMELSSLRARNLTDTPGSEVGIAWSPDGGQIAYVTNAFGALTIHTLDTESGETATQVTVPSVGQLTWLADGMHLGYVGRTNSDSSAIYVHTLGSSERPRPVFAGLIGSVAWSPQGDRFVVPVQLGLTVAELFVVDVASGRATQITFDGTGWKGMPSWSPDGEWIAFEGNGGESLDVFRIKPDGSKMQNLTRTPLAYERAPIWSPSGDQIACTTTTDVWLIDPETSSVRDLLHMPATALSWFP